MSKDAIYRIRHLQKLVVNQSEVRAKKFGGFPNGKSQTIENGKNFFLIDQAGFQWQNDKRNSGCIFFYPDDNSDKNYQTFQKDMYRVTFQEERPEQPSQNNIDVKWKIGGIRGNDYNDVIDGKIDLDLLKKGFKEEFKQAFFSANHAFNLDKSDDKYCLRFTKAGLGFFASRIAKEGTNANKKFSQARLEGIAEALEEISKSKLDKSKKFDTLELPFSEDSSIENYEELLNKIKTNAQKIGIDNVSLGVIDALKVNPDYKVALTNCADPHAMVGNEGGYQSVDAMIATNCGKSSQNVNVAYNQKFVELSYDSKSLSLSSTKAQPALDKAKEPQQKEIRDKKYFWFSGFGKYSKENNGDGDYVKQMIAILKSKGKDAEWIKTVGESDAWKNYEIELDNKEGYENFNNDPSRKAEVKKIINYIKANSTDKDPVFHLTIRAPETGYIITPTDLLDFKEAGIQVVVTCHEYFINIDTNRENFKKSSLAYFEKADQVIFVNEKSKNKAIEDCKACQGQQFHNIDDFTFPLPESLTQKSTFCPIPATIKPKEENKNIDTIIQEILDRPPSILVFGNFRRLKGFEDNALELAKIIDAIKKGEWDKIIPTSPSLQNSFNTEEKKSNLQGKFKDTKIIFAGSINPKFPDIYKAIAEASFDYRDTIELHPNPSTLGFNSKADLTDERIKAAEKDSFISEQELAELSKRCLYAFKGDDTGMRDNASGIISSMALGCITFCKASRETDQVFLKSNHSLTGDGEYIDSYIRVAKNAVCSQIINNLSSLEPENLKKIVEKQQELLQKRFGPENINSIHDEVYNKLSAIDDKVSETNKKTSQAQQTLTESHDSSLLEKDIGSSSSTSSSSSPSPSNSPSTSPSTSKIRNTTTTNDLKFKITSYGVLGLGKDTPRINDGLKNRRNFVIVDPALTAFSDTTGDLSSPSDSGGIYEVMGTNNKTIAQSRPTATESKEGFKIHNNGKITKIYSGYAVFNNVWQPNEDLETPAGVIHTVGPQNADGQNHPTTSAHQGPQEILTQALKNTFIEYKNCSANDSEGNKPGLRIPAISSELCCRQKSEYPEMLYKALTEGYKQACDEVGDIDFGKHGLEICMYTKIDYKNLKEEIEKTKYKEEEKTISIPNKEQVSPTLRKIKGNLFHPKSFCITKQSASKNDYTETIKIPDDNHEHDFFIGQNSDLLKNNDDLSPIIPSAQTINEALKKNLDEAQSYSGLTKEEAAIVILIAIKNKGVSNNIEAFKRDIKLINPDDEAFLKKATLFSSSFQQKNYSQSILTGNPEPTNIVGMRLKRLTADYAYEMLTDKSKFDELYQKLQIDKSGSNSQKSRAEAMVTKTQVPNGVGASYS